MPILTKFDKNILFIHIPKTAGTYITQMFINNGYNVSLTNAGIFKDLVITNDSPVSDWCSPQHYRGESLVKYNNKKAFDKIFTIVREPLARLISEYNFRRNDPQYHDTSFPGVNHVNDTDDNISETFHRWVELIFDVYRDDNNILDNHVRPQHEFLTDDTHILKLESGTVDIYKKIKLFIQDQNFTYLKGRVFRTPTNYILPENVDSRTISLVKRFYKDDYSRLGYET